MKLNKNGIILITFLIVYFILLMLKTPNDMIIDESAHTMDSFFYYNLIKDSISNPNILLNLKNYIFRFYSFYPALYVVYYPPLFSFLSSLLFLAFGPSQLTARLISMIFSIMSFIVLYYLGKELYDKKVGLLSIFVLAFAPYFFVFSNLAMIDISLLFFILLSILLFYRGVEKNKKYFYYFGVVFGLGFLMKLEILVLIFPFIIYLLYRKKLKGNLKTLFKSSLYFLIIVFPYLIIFFFFKGVQTLSTWMWFEAYYGEFFKYIYYYPSILFYEIFPLVFLIPIFYFLWYRKFKKEDIFLLYIIAIYFIFFTFLPAKTTQYIIPNLPLFSLLFVSVLTKIKKWSRFMFATILISQFIIALFFPPYDTIVNIYNPNLEEVGKYLNENIIKNGNIFLLPPFDEAELIFNFARLNNFENHVFRLRDCTFENVTTKEFQDFVSKNNIYFIVAGKVDTIYPHIREWINNSFEKVDVNSNLLIYKSYKKSFKSIGMVCQYNCRIKMEICFNSTTN